jgi:hypothetical protein
MEVTKDLLDDLHPLSCLISLQGPEATKRGLPTLRAEKKTHCY